MRIASRITRSRHGVFYFRVVIPGALRAAVNGQRELRLSLRTKDVAIGRLRARLMSLRADGAFLSIREGSLAYDPKKFNPKDPSTFPTSKDIAGRYEIERDAAKVRVKTDGTPEDHRNAMQALKNLTGISLESVAMRTEKDFEHLQPQNLREAVRDALSEEKGASDPLHLMIESWKAQLIMEKNAPATSSEYPNIVTRFAEFYGKSKPVNSVKRKDISAFINQCDVELPTQSKYAGALIAFFDHAIRQGHYHEDNPARKVVKFTKKMRSKRSGYAAFTPEQLKLIFNPKKYLSFNKKPHEYWASLIALYTGARINEICQLLVSEITTIDDIPYITIKVDPEDEAEDDDDYDDEGSEHRTLKSDAATRTIPIHPVLMELGLWEYANDVRALCGNDARLFPYLVADAKGKFSKNTGRRFREYLKTMVIYPATNKPIYRAHKTVFHSFRKTLNHLMKNKRLTLEERCEYLGHRYEITKMAPAQEPYNIDHTPQHFKEHVISEISFAAIAPADLKYKREEMRQRLERECKAGRKRKAHTKARKQRASRRKKK